MDTYDDISYIDIEAYITPNFTMWNTSNITDFNYVDDLCEAGEQEFTIKTFQTCVFCLIFVLGVMGNCLVIATFALYRRLQLRCMTDIFLFQLALADLLLLLTLPLQAVETHLGWIFSSALCRATRACYAINTYSGLLLLACVSVDRYMVVAHAQEMLRFRTRILTGGTVAAVGMWLVAVLLSLPEILYSGVSRTAGDAYCGMIKSGSVKMATNGTIIAVFCLTLVVMVTCYSLIACVLWEGTALQRGKRWLQQRTLKLMVALVLVFLVFQLPYTVVLSRKMAGEFCGLLLEYTTCTLAFTRCCLNPILYALAGVRFRRDVLRLVRHWRCCHGHSRHRYSGAASASISSPTLTALSPCSPTSFEQSSSGNKPPNKFSFPGTK